MSYIEDVLKKFNENPEDESLTDAEKTLLGQVREVEKTVSEMAERINNLENEIGERRNKIAELSSNLLFAKGMSRGLTDALNLLKK